MCRGTVAHPHRDWRAVCALFGILFLIFAVFDVWMYFSSSNIGETGQRSAVVGNSVLSAFTPERLGGVLSVYESLGAEHTKLLSAPPAVADPSK